MIISREAVITNLAAGATWGLPAKVHPGRSLLQRHSLPTRLPGSAGCRQLPRGMMRLEGCIGAPPAESWCRPQRPVTHREI